MSIYEQYIEQRGRLAASYIVPTRITFSPTGYANMMREKESMTMMLNLGSAKEQPGTYDGLPLSVVNEQTEEVKIHNAMTDPPKRQNAITVKIDGIMGGAPVVDIIAANLTAAQLCDIIQAWLDSDDHSHFGAFEKGLKEVLTKEGRYE